MRQTSIQTIDEFKLIFRRTVTETDRQHGNSFPTSQPAVTQTTSNWPFLAKNSPNSIQRIESDSNKTPVQQMPNF